MCLHKHKHAFEDQQVTEKYDLYQLEDARITA